MMVHRQIDSDQREFGLGSQASQAKAQKTSFARLAPPKVTIAIGGMNRGHGGFLLPTSVSHDKEMAVWPIAKHLQRNLRGRMV
jgi:hypothetical protein